MVSGGGVWRGFLEGGSGGGFWRGFLERGSGGALEGISGLF